MFRWRKRPQQPEQAHGPALHCSFCNKSQYDVAKMIAGPNVQICNECVDICMDVLAHEKPGGNKGTAASERQDHPLWCSICRVEVPLASTIAVHERGYVCRDCAAAVAVALTSRLPNSR